MAPCQVGPATRQSRASAGDDRQRRPRRPLPDAAGCVRAHAGQPRLPRRGHVQRERPPRRRVARHARARLRVGRRRPHLGAPAGAARCGYRCTPPTPTSWSHAWSAPTRRAASASRRPWTASSTATRCLTPTPSPRSPAPSASGCRCPSARPCRGRGAFAWWSTRRRPRVRRGPRRADAEADPAGEGVAGVGHRGQAGPGLLTPNGRRVAPRRESARGDRGPGTARAEGTAAVSARRRAPWP